MREELTPSVIVAELDRYIIGQHEAKKSVAIALRNRWRRMQAGEELRKEIVPNNILMIGPTGVGKTEIARRLARLADAPFVKVEASKFTEVGYVGRDVESMVRDLAEQSVNMVKTEKKKEIAKKALENAHNTLLDILIPPIRKKKTPDYLSVGQKDLSSASEIPADASDEELNERTRERFRVMLENGELDDKKVEIEVSAPASHVQVMAPGGGMEAMEGLQEMLQGMIPKKTRKRSLTVKEARELLVEEESQKLIDMEAVVREAMERASNNGIIFIDEIDKIASGKGVKGGGPDVSREGVQRDLLPIVEGSAVNTKYGTLKTDHILFVAAGAFHVAKPSDLIPELQGRFPIRVELESLSKEDFLQILQTPQNALTKQYEALLSSEGVEIVFENSALVELADTAWTVNQEIENIGARRLHTIMSALLNDILFDVPDKTDNRRFVIDQAFVKQKLAKFRVEKDLSRYIL